MEIVHYISDKKLKQMSNEIDYFPRGSAITKTDIPNEKSRINRVDRDDLFLGTSSKRKHSQQTKSEQKQKKKKSLDGEDHQNTLYRRLHKQVCSFIFIVLEKNIFFIHRILLMVF
jgi:hypothetical protein